jgi:hypothetical protein
MWRSAATGAEYDVARSRCGAPRHGSVAAPGPERKTITSDSFFQAIQAVNYLSFRSFSLAQSSFERGFLRLSKSPLPVDSPGWLTVEEISIALTFRPVSKGNRAIPDCSWPTAYSSMCPWSRPFKIVRGPSTVVFSPRERACSIRSTYRCYRRM